MLDQSFCERVTVTMRRLQRWPMIAIVWGNALSRALFNAPFCFDGSWNCG
ncbi:MAG: hypothetical protein ACLVJ6_16505 [Merdibacter sp.]